ncbi:hypothetical protein Tco_0625040 [Tanacetum coccineum]|uniref:Uncharacterized protein n=1 Tax=Tanacetum coccineum TaxID=301880 RepID=A0ABQ4WFM6_9ASTR
MSHEKVAEEMTDTHSDTKSRPTGTLEESTQSKPLTKFTYITEKGENVKLSNMTQEKSIQLIIVVQDVSWVDYHLSRIRKKLDALHKIEQELELDLSKPLEEQDPIIKLDLLIKKKRKHVDDLHDYFRATKRYKKFVQYGNFQAGIILNEPTLGMILFNTNKDKISTKLKILKN